MLGGRRSAGADRSEAQLPAAQRTRKAEAVSKRNGPAIFAQAGPFFISLTAPHGRSTKGTPGDLSTEFFVIPGMAVGMLHPLRGFFSWGESLPGRNAYRRPS